MIVQIFFAKNLLSWIAFFKLFLRYCCHLYVLSPLSLLSATFFSFFHLFRKQSFLLFLSLLSTTTFISLLKSTVVSYTNESFSLKWELPACPHPLFIGPFLVVSGRQKRQLLFEWNTLIWIGQYIRINDFFKMIVKWMLALAVCKFASSSTFVI